MISVEHTKFHIIVDHLSKDAKQTVEEYGKLVYIFLDLEVIWKKLIVKTCLLYTSDAADEDISV